MNGTADSERSFIRPIPAHGQKGGLITEIDRWVITHATKFAAGGPTVAINLSAMSAGHPSMLDLIERELHHYGRPSPINMNGVPNMVAAVQ